MIKLARGGFKPTKGTSDGNGQKKRSQIIMLLHGVSELQLTEKSKKKNIHIQGCIEEDRAQQSRGMGTL